MKNQNVILILSLIVFVFLISCGGGVSDQKIELSEGYFYMGEGPNANTINRLVSVDKNSQTEEIVIYPDVRGFVFNNEYILIRQMPDSIGYSIRLSTELENNAWVFNFVDTTETIELPSLVRRDYHENKKDSAFYRFLNIHTSLMNQDEKRLFLRSVADSILRNNLQYANLFSGEIKYWIIDKKRNKTMGPFDLRDFEMKKLGLNIPETLSLGSE